MARVFIAIALVATLAAQAQAQEDKKPPSARAKKAMELVAEHLRKLGGTTEANLLARENAALTATFPDHDFIIARYRIYPVARILPKGLKPSNIFAVKDDRALLVADTGNNRIVRINPSSGSSVEFAQISSPRGLDVGSDGTVYVVDSGANRVLRLSAAGSRIGYLARTSGDLYDVQVTRSGLVYVLEAGTTGRVRRIARDGNVTTVSRG